MSESSIRELLQERRSLQGRLKSLDAEIQTLQSGLAGHEMVEVATGDGKIHAKLKELEGSKRAFLVRQMAVDEEISQCEDRLSRLRHWLGLEAVGGVSILLLAKGSFYVSAWVESLFGNVPIVYWYAPLILAALAFTPYMIRTLILEQRWNWIIAFAVLVCAPCSLMLIPTGSSVLTLIFQLFPLLMFYTYCGLLRWAVSSWLE